MLKNQQIELFGKPKPFFKILIHFFLKRALQQTMILEKELIDLMENIEVEKTTRDQFFQLLKQSKEKIELFEFKFAKKYKKSCKYFKNKGDKANDLKQNQGFYLIEQEIVKTLTENLKLYKQKIQIFLEDNDAKQLRLLVNDILVYLVKVEFLVV